MACVCPPHTSIKRYCRAGSVNLRISSDVFVINSGRRNSSTYRIPTSRTRAILHGLFHLIAANLQRRRFGFAECFKKLQLLPRVLFADLAHREPNVNQNPVAGSPWIAFLDQAQIDFAPDAEHLDQRQRIVAFDQIHDFSRYCEAHTAILSLIPLPSGMKHVTVQCEPPRSATLRDPLPASQPRSRPA